jgi:hypothetical protein
VLIDVGINVGVFLHDLSLRIDDEGMARRAPYDAKVGQRAISVASESQEDHQ